MFGKLQKAAIGVVAVGLLALGTPASAAAPTSAPGKDATASTAINRQALRELLQKTGARDVSDLVKLQVRRADQAHRTAGTRSAAQTAPYVVWVQNQTSLTLGIRLYWEQTNISGVVQMDAALGGGQEAPYILDQCSLIIDYLLFIYYNGELVARTPNIVYPGQIADGSQCQDYWGIKL